MFEDRPLGEWIATNRNRTARYVASIAFLMCGFLFGHAEGQSVLPGVSFAEVPLYPPLARAASVAGVVHVVVTTDGHRVVTARVQDGNQILADAAEKNAKGWQFASHEPTSFTVTYIYKLVKDLKVQQDNPRVILKLPLEIEIDSARWIGTRDMPAATK